MKTTILVITLLSLSAPISADLECQAQVVVSASEVQSELVVLPIIEVITLPIVEDIKRAKVELSVVIVPQVASQMVILQPPDT